MKVNPMVVILLIIFSLFVAVMYATLSEYKDEPIINNYEKENTVSTYVFKLPEPLKYCIWEDKPEPLDINKLADAVAIAETGYCTSSGSLTANSRNNCWGIMTWKSGTRDLKVFPSIEAGKREFIYIWKKSYKIYPNLSLANKWTGRDKAQTWLENVDSYYYNKK